MRGNNPMFSTKTARFSQYLSKFSTELPQTTTNHDMDHYKWWHESSQITTNHHKFTMTWITTNHKSLQITTNHDINHHEPWQKPAQSMTWITTNHHKPMTWTIMMTQKELCIKPYGFLVVLMDYRSGTVNSKLFVGKVLLRIKWKFELIYAL